MIIFSRIVLIFSLSFIAGPNCWIAAMNIDSFHTKGTLHKKIQALFSDLGKSFETVSEANAFCQKFLLRKGERWDMQKETPFLKECAQKKEIIIDHLKQLGMIDATYPAKKNFTYCLCMGATKPAIEKNLKTIAHLQENGYSFDHIVLLSGARPLMEGEKKDLPHEITTEADLMKYLYNHHSELQKERMICIDAPMVPLPNGTMRRPNTDDTLILFQKKVSDGGACLIVSSNPYLFRQAKVAQRILDQNKFPTYGAGDAFNPNTDIAIILDELARAIYEEHQRLD